MARDIFITCSDKRELSATIYPSKSKRSFIVFNSALGIKKEFYRDFIEFLVSNGHSVLSWDARGIGKSQHKDGVKYDTARMRDWGQIDFEAIINYVLSEKLALEEELIVFGHSAGGHLVGLAPSIKKVKKIVLISSGTCSWSLYRLQSLPKILFSWLILVPATVRLYGYAPGKLGIGHDLPRGVIMDWRNWSLKRNYLFSDKSIGEMYYKEVKGSVYAIGFSDDTDFSPEKTIVDLLTYFPNAAKKLKVYTPKELNTSKIGHFSFFKKNNITNWRKIIEPLL